MPLTAASDLPNHPTLSKPFTSATLTNLTEHAGDMLRKERTSLWRIKHLLTRLSGDSTWIPGESVETKDDFLLFFDDREKQRAIIQGKAIPKDADQGSTQTLSDNEQPAGLLSADVQSLGSVGETVKQITESAAENEDVTMTSVDGLTENGHSGKEAAQLPVQDSHPEENSRENGSSTYAKGKVPENSAEGHVAENGAMKDSTNESEQPVEDIEMDGVGGGADPEDLAVEAPRRMTTRARAQAASDHTASIRTRSISPETNNEPYIHPYFLAPASSRPDRDVGLPQQEAEEIRRLLQLYIQKQEEVCRGVQRIYEGLLRADRQRKLVLKWTKAEAHIGANRDMSDGEDWYDKEEWNLSEDLKKGQDEEEEDAATTAKKTRTRRQ